MQNEAALSKILRRLASGWEWRSEEKPKAQGPSSNFQPFLGPFQRVVSRQHSGHERLFNNGYNASTRHSQPARLAVTWLLQWHMCEISNKASFFRPRNVFF